MSAPDNPLPEDVIARLTASRDRYHEEQRRVGHAAGRAWAMRSAGYDDLAELARWTETASEPWTLTDLYRIVAEVESDGPLNDDNVDGFVEGALEVIEQFGG